MAASIRKISGGVTAARGFEAAGIACGIKINGPANRLDLTLIQSTEGPTATAATFTTNRVKAAPVRVSQMNLRGGDIRAIIANSGNANACTGVGGIEDARAMCKAAAEVLDLRRRQVLVCSTGIIGLPLPIEKITTRVPELASRLRRGQGGEDAAQAILTSDTGPKSLAYKIALPGGKSVRVGGLPREPE